MSYDEYGYEEEDEPIDWAKKARTLQETMADVPRQAQIVRKMTSKEGKKLRREIRRVASPRAVSPSEAPRVKSVTFNQFAGQRRKKKGVWTIFTKG